MRDFFAVLDETRRPWLEPDRLKATFLRLSSEVHPDRLHTAPPKERKTANQRHIEINAAYSCLVGLKERLSHLVLLETGRPSRKVESIPADIAERFIAVGRICGEADRLLARAGEVVSPVVKVEIVTAALDLGDRLEKMVHDLSQPIASIEGELRSMNAAWESAPRIGEPGRLEQLPLVRLEDLYRRVAYLDKCGQQLRERATKLSIYCAS